MSATTDARSDAQRKNAPVPSVDLQPQPALKEGFHMVNDAGADRYLSRLAALEAERARVQSEATRSLRGIDARAQRVRYLLQEQLRTYALHRLRLREGPETTLRLRQGTCVFATLPQGLRLTDAAAAVAYSREHAFALLRISVIEKLDTEQHLKVADRWLAETGELLPGVERMPEEVRFSVEFGPADVE